MFATQTKRQMSSRVIFRVAGRTRALTDLTRASRWRIITEEMIIEEFLALNEGLVREHGQWFLQGATGDNLDRRIADFGIVRPGPFPGTGFVKLVTVGEDGDDTITIAPGQIFRTDPTDGSTQKRYRANANPDQAQGLWENVTVGDVIAVTALIAGTDGNTPSNSITVAEGIQATCTNLQPVTDGRPKFDDPQFFSYFLTTLDGLARSTRAAMQFHILNYVDPTAGGFPVFSVAFEEWNGQQLLSGTGRLLAARVYICGGNGLASDGLVAAIQRLVDGDDTENSGLRAAGVPMEVVSATPLPVEVLLSVDVDGATNPQTARHNVDQAVRQFINQTPCSGVTILGALKGQLNYARMFRTVMDVPGILSARFTYPTADRAVPVGAKVVPGNIRVNVNTVLS